MKKKYLYTKTNQVKDWGAQYDKKYSRDYYDNRVWQIEKRLLAQILKGKENCKIMDFACGTGRITKYLERIGFKKITGCDASEEMMKEARKKSKKIKYVKLEIGDSNSGKEVRSKSFDIITAFRFFLNADEELKRDAISELDSLLAKGGLLIFNIHSNKTSLRFFEVSAINFLKFFFQRGKRKRKEDIPYRCQMSINDVKKILRDTNLEIKKVYSYSFLPKFFVKILSRDKWVEIENKFVSNRKLFGSHLMFVCKKK